MSNELLVSLASRINEAHGKCEAAARGMLQHAIDTGNLLIEAKALCAHGEWGQWLRDNCALAETTARLYMRIARELPKTATVADLTIRDAARMLAAPPASPESDGPMSVDQARDSARKIKDGLEQSIVQLSTLAKQMRDGDGWKSTHSDFASWFRDEVQTPLREIVDRLGEGDPLRELWMGAFDEAVAAPLLSEVAG